MTRLEKIIGFPVAKEHRKELKERLEMYENCDRTTLISLLLQYDWELLQLQDHEHVGEISCKNDFMDIGKAIETSIKATHSARAIAEMKRDNADYINKVIDIMRDLTDDRLGDKFMNDLRKRLEEQ